MHRRLLYVMLFSALGCAAPALAGPPKDGGESTVPEDDAPDEAPDEGEETPNEGDEEPGEGKAPAAEEDPPKEPREAPEPDDEPEEPAEEPKPPPKPPAVTLSDPEFINGDVPKVASILRRTAADVSECVAEHGGLEAEKGLLKVQFLVRARGKAEGVEILERKAVSTDAGRCVQKLLKNKWVGMPSVDPTGVQFRYELKSK